MKLSAMSFLKILTNTSGEKIVNFDIIYKFIRGEKISEADLKNYQTAKYERVSKYPQKDKNNFGGLLLETIERIFTLIEKL